MLPILFATGPFVLRTWSVFAAWAFLVAAFVFWRKGREEHYSEASLLDGFLVSFALGLVAARVGFIILRFNEFNFDVVGWLDLVGRPGLSWLFGLLGATVALLRFAGRQKWDRFEILDFWVMSLSWGMVWIWLGWFFDGSRFGIETNLPWGLQFPGVLDRHHPTQLYAALGYGVIFSYLSWLEYHYRTFEWYKARRKSAQTGFLVSVFLMLHGFLSLGLSYVMQPQLQVFNFALDKALAGVAIATGIIVLWIRSGRLQNIFKKRGSTPPSTN